MNTESNLPIQRTLQGSNDVSVKETFIPGVKKPTWWNKIVFKLKMIVKKAKNRILDIQEKIGLKKRTKTHKNYKKLTKEIYKKGKFVNFKDDKKLKIIKKVIQTINDCNYERARFENDLDIVLFAELSDKKLYYLTLLRFYHPLTKIDSEAYNLINIFNKNSIENQKINFEQQQGVKFENVQPMKSSVRDAFADRLKRFEQEGSQEIDNREINEDSIIDEN
jgi:hypothetical protein